MYAIDAWRKAITGVLPVTCLRDTVVYLQRTALELDSVQPISRLSNKLTISVPTRLAANI
jgi:hypothetical protein